MTMRHRRNRGSIVFWPLQWKKNFIRSFCDMFALCDLNIYLQSIVSGSILFFNSLFANHALAPLVRLYAIQDSNLTLACLFWAIKSKFTIYFFSTLDRSFLWFFIG